MPPFASAPVVPPKGGIQCLFYIAGIAGFARFCLAAKINDSGFRLSAERRREGKVVSLWLTAGILDSRLRGNDGVGGGCGIGGERLRQKAAGTPPVCIPTLERGNEKYSGDSRFFFFLVPKFISAYICRAIYCPNLYLLRYAPAFAAINCGGNACINKFMHEE